MKVKITTLLVFIFLYFCQFNLFARETQCKTVTYRDIVNEMEGYSCELEKIESAYSYYRFQYMTNPNNSHDRKMKELMNKKEVYLRGLAKRQESIDRLQIDITNCLLGSPTGYCLRDGVLEKEHVNKKYLKEEKDKARNNNELD
ncbi:MAG: hypothetical protein QS748_13155 [Candidatus Endonucleobacter bathymodioli]|uniref:Uncharacterized protein n=1 Tax=Candidatus Endonucleibacter bathymodioli TaxID=539814 RepID=A0AA90NYG2_9GAMM|nr:hypothetical protein [Candidatus Endonucleobacter bathymodioli]